MRKAIEIGLAVGLSLLALVALLDRWLPSILRQLPWEERRFREMLIEQDVSQRTTVDVDASDAELIRTASDWTGDCPTLEALIERVVQAGDPDPAMQLLDELQATGMMGCRAAARCYVTLTIGLWGEDVEAVMADRVSRSWGYDGHLVPSLADDGRAHAPADYVVRGAIARYRIARRALDAAEIDPMDAVPACPAEDRPRLDRAMPYKKGETAHRWRPDAGG